MPQSPFSRREMLLGMGAMTAFAALPQFASAQKTGQSKPFASPVPAFDNDPILTTKIADNLFTLTGMGGNILLMTGEDGPLLVDTGVPARARDVLKAATAAAHHPVVTVINTHFHFDHTGGNSAFGKAKARIVAHDATRERLQSDFSLEPLGIPISVPASPAIALPTLTFTDALTLHLNGETIDLLHVAPAHTDSDLIVHFQKANVIHAGDLFFNGVYPVIDYSSRGWIGGMVAGIDKALALANAQTQIVPGHGPVGNKASLQASRELLAAVQAKIEPMVKDGKSADEIVAAKPTAEYDAVWGKGLLNADSFVKMTAVGIQRHNG